MKHIIAAVLLLGASNVFSQEVDKTFMEQCLYPTVMVRSIRSPAGGSGVIIRSDKVGDEYHNVALTCAHVVSDGPYYRIQAPFYDKSELKGFSNSLGKVFRKDDSKDVALVLFMTKDPVFVADIEFKPNIKIGSRICHLGCGSDSEPRLDFGEVTSIGVMRPENDPLKGSVRTNIFIIPGDSGGPSYFDLKLVGITQAVKVINRNGDEHPAFKISYYVPLSRFKKWDTELNKLLEFSYSKKAEMPVIWRHFVEFEMSSIITIPMEKE